MLVPMWMGTNMPSPYKGLQIWAQNVSKYLAYKKLHWPESWQRSLCIYLLSYPSFWIYSIEWFWFLCLMTWQWKPAKNLKYQICMHWKSLPNLAKILVQKSDFIAKILRKVVINLYLLVLLGHWSVNDAIVGSLLKPDFFKHLLVIFLLQGVPKVRSSPLRVCNAVRLDWISKSFKYKLCLFNLV